MKRIRIVGVCLVAACAFSMVMVASASAIAPEFGRCINVGAEGKQGSFIAPAEPGKSPECTTTSTEASKNVYEWFPAFVPSKKWGERPAVKKEFTSHMTSTLATLEGEPAPGKTNGVQISCKHQKLTHNALITGKKTVAKIQATYTECASSGVGCQSAGAAAKEIVTTELGAVLGLQSGTKPAATDKVASLIFPATPKGPLAEFECTNILKVRVKGDILHPATVNKMLLKATEKFTATKGEQKPSKFSAKGEPLAAEACQPEGLEEVGGVKPKDKTVAEEEVNGVKECDNHNLISKLALSEAANYEESGQSQTNVTEDEEKLEISNKL